MDWLISYSNIAVGGGRRAEGDLEELGQFEIMRQPFVNLGQNIWRSLPLPPLFRHTIYFWNS